MQTNQTARQVGKMVIDGGLAGAAFLVAIALRLDGEFGERTPSALAAALPAVLGVVALATPLVAAATGAYRALWRFTSVRELGALLLTSAVVSGALVALRLAGVSPVPGSIAVIFGVLFFATAAGARLARRVLDARGARRAEAVGAGPAEGARPVLLVGAGRTANALLQNLRANAGHGWKVVGVLDDDPVKRGMRVQGHPVLGPTTDLERVAVAHGVRHVVLAMPKASRAVTNDLLTRAQAAGLTVQSVPLVASLFEDRVSGDGASLPLAPRTVTLHDLVDSAEVKRTLLPNVARRDERKTILVTGGAGYIGSHLVRKLLDRGHHVRVLDNFTYGDAALAPMRSHPRLEVVQGDISSIRDVVSAVKDVDTVIALAAIVGDPACGLNAEETLNLNYESTKVLVETCNFYGVRRLVFASSCSVYGASSGEEALTEESALNPVSLYARTRILSEQVLFDRCGDMTTTVLRLSTVFGQSDRMRFDLVVNTLTARAVIDGRFQVFGGDQWRPFVHCQDAAEAFLLAATAPADRVNRQVFNVGSADMNFTITQVGETVQELVGGHVVMQVEGAGDDARNYRVSFDKIARTLGFQRAYDLRSGIAEMAEAVRANTALQDYNQPIYSNFKLMQERMEAENLVG